MENKLKLGGGAAKIEKIHKQGKLTARERIELLFDKDAYQQEIGLLVAYDEYDGKAPAAAVVTSVGKIHGREAVVIANDATIKAGAWYPETIKKILRAQEIAMRNRVPIIYLVDSAGVNLPYQGGVFPGQYGAARIFYYNSIMRRYLKVPQISAVMGMCVAGGAYLPALSDVILMVEGTSFMGLGGANLVKGATGQTIDNETLGGAMTHNSISGVAHFHTKDEPECLEKIRQLVSELPNKFQTNVSIIEAQEPKNAPEKLYEILPEDHRAGYDIREVLSCFLDGGELDEFQADYAKEMICGTARIGGIQIGSHRQSSRNGDAKRKTAKVRRHRLHRIGGKNRVFYRKLQSSFDTDSFCAGRFRLYGRRGRGAFGHYSRGREICRSDGDGNRAETRFDDQSRFGRGLLRDGWTGL